MSVHRSPFKDEEEGIDISLTRRGNGIYIRPYDVSDAEALLALAIKNKKFFKEFLPAREPSYFSLDGQMASIQRAIEAAEQDLGYSFGIFLASKDELIGNITLFEIERVYQTCMVGYWLNESHNGHGYTTGAVRLVLTFAFEVAKFHRVEAGVMPKNIGSIRVLEKTGFQKEGLCRKNVMINGIWEDHLMYAVLEEDPRPVPERPDHEEQ